MSRFLIDTNALYAFVMGDDEYHLVAEQYVRSALNNRDVFVLLDVIFMEAMTLLRSHAGPAISIRAGREFRSHTLYQWQPLGVGGERDTWAIFQQYDDKDWSYVDCALLAMAQRMGIKQIFSFDDHIDQMPHLTRVPKAIQRARRR